MDVSSAGHEETRRFVGFGGARLRDTAVPTETPVRKPWRVSEQRRCLQILSHFRTVVRSRDGRVTMPPIPQLRRDYSLRR